MSAERISNKVEGVAQPPPFISPAIISNGFVFCSGQIGSTSDGQLVKGPIKNRVNQIMDNLDKVLKAHGSSLQDTVKFNLYITSYDDFAEINETYTKRIPSPAPTRTCIGVKSLPFGTDIEIECIGAIPSLTAKIKAKL
ncbi:uncharacterized protein L201_000055 [Kwoniella dendrophila CBS 6074]|uniref:Uncharacterized protein n=1 Tax=Kwoniella dendrophila CBS 6074 TaxID=1295534 RepID=A0AAX4JI95_9TREE